jgi:hypothetical protein
MISNMNSEMSKLLTLGLAQEKLFSSQVLCLPENIFDAAPGEGLLEPSDSVDFGKRLKAAGLKCATAFDLGLKTSILERRAGDKWLAVLYVRDKVAIPLVVSVVSGLIVAAAVHATANSGGKTPQPQVHLELYLERTNGVSRISYVGDGETLVNVLKSLEVK